MNIKVKVSWRWPLHYFWLLQHVSMEHAFFVCIPWGFRLWLRHNVVFCCWVGQFFLECCFSSVGNLDLGRETPGRCMFYWHRATPLLLFRKMYVHHQTTVKPSLPPLPPPSPLTTTDQLKHTTWCTGRLYPRREGWKAQVAQISHRMAWHDMAFRHLDRACASFMTKQFAPVAPDYSVSWSWQRNRVL